MTEAALEAALASHPRIDMPALPGRTNHVKAGVLLPLFPEGDDLTVLLTERSRALRQHAGEICFPGGRMDDTDASVAATALREAEEEVGLTSARIVGRLSSIPLYTSDFRLEPFVAWCSEPLSGLRPSPDEVASLVPVSMFALAERSFVHGVTWSRDGIAHLSPIFEAPEGSAQPLIFGGTAYALYELLGVVAKLRGRDVPPLKSGRYTWADVLD